MEAVVVLDSSDEERESSEPAAPSPEPIKRPKLAVEIQPAARYVPGCGPALQPLRLLPPETSTGFIIERILLPSPGLAADGKLLPKRMTYIVGWRDLPAASLLVPAMQILDYVSPRALEDWEEALEVGMEEERTKLAEEKINGPPNMKQKHKARPPAHTDIEAAAAIEPETEAEDALRPKMGGAMSLSTPQKRKLADFEGLSDDEDSPSNQIAREIFGQDSREDSWDVPVPGTRAEDEQVGLRDAVGEDGPHTSTKTMVATPVPLPSYVSGTMRPGISLPELRPVSASTPEAIYFPKQPDPTGPVSSIEGNALSGATSLDGFPGGYSLSKPSSTRESTGDTSRHTSAKPRKANGSAKKPKPSQPKPKKRKTSQDVADVGQNDEPTWEVERLEDRTTYEVEGLGTVRYFMVRWAGDWPPDQKTSWEPEENIPRNLVRSYTKMDKKKRAKLAAQHQHARIQWQNAVSGGVDAAHSSASEAFAEVDVQNDAPFGSTSHDFGAEERPSVEDDLGNEVHAFEDESGTGRSFHKEPVQSSTPPFGIY